MWKSPFLKMYLFICMSAYYSFIFICLVIFSSFVALHEFGFIFHIVDNVTEFRPKSALDTDAKESIFLLRYVCLRGLILYWGS